MTNEKEDIPKGQLSTSDPSYRVMDFRLQVDLRSDALVSTLRDGQTTETKSWPIAADDSEEVMANNIAEMNQFVGEAAVVLMRKVAEDALNELVQTEGTDKPPTVDGDSPPS